MKCLSRSTSGVILGTCNIFVYSCVAILAINDLITINALKKSEKAKIYEVIKKENYDSAYYSWEEEKNMEDLQESINDAALTIGNTVFSIILVVALTMIIISGLLIVGIVKRRHSLMAPWLVLSSIGFISSCIRTVLDLFRAIAAAIPIGEIMLAFIIKSLTLCLTAFILYYIYTLYRDIRDKNNGLPVPFVADEKIDFTNDDAIKSKHYIVVSQKA